MAMGARIRELLGAERPVFGFGMKLEVAIAASRAGGVGIWGCTRNTPEEIEEGVTRMQDALGDLPWGVDLVIPAGMPETNDRASIEAQLPPDHVAFVDGMRERHGVPDDGVLKAARSLALEVAGFPSGSTRAMKAHLSRMAEPAATGSDRIDRGADLLAEAGRLRPRRT